ncbi:MAG: phosphoribosyltransferase [Verrucomicrobiota bacterium]|jgi:putative phosphoribosyl transferase
MDSKYRNRSEAGRFLSQKLSDYAHRPDVVVLALPRGGVPVAYEVAKALGATLDIFLVRKLGLPGHEELAMGAIASGGVRVLNDSVVRAFNIGPATMERVTADEQRRLEHRERLYRGKWPFPELSGKIVILVDDGLATGSSMRAAVTALRQKHPARIVIAVPTAAPETCEAFRHEVDEVVCGRTPDPFLAVGLWYKDFSQTSDDEVRDLLEKAHREQLATAAH